MTVIQEDLDLPGTGGTPHPAEVRIRVAGPQGRPVLARHISNPSVIIGERVLRSGDGINAAGVWSEDLVPNSDIDPAGTTYLVSRRTGCFTFSTYINVPVTGGPYEAYTREDDPLGTVTPSALSSHAGDLTLHGGGVIIDSAFIDTTVTVTGSGGGLFASPITGLLVTVPDLARPVMLWAHIPAIQPPGGSSEASVMILPQGNTGVFASLDGVPVPDMDTATARVVDPRALLPAHTPGDYIVGATGVGGNLTARIPASSLGKATLWAVQV